MPLILRRHRDHFRDNRYSEDMYVVVSGQMVVGTITKESGGARGEGFGWWINGVQIAPAIAKPKGFAPTLDQAKAELAANWRTWLAYAGLRDDEAL